eukprot:Seg1733.2 transcript_id=Seg1733.2/GoldUCD/mRNA.D3Y31 product="Cyclic nucleotide-binding domain-containing protein 2" protein_id=Seg1733.2/GoldUCD/D3Y31
MYQSYFKTSSNYVLPDQFDEALHIDSSNKIEEVDISRKGEPPVPIVPHRRTSQTHQAAEKAWTAPIKNQDHRGSINQERRSRKNSIPENKKEVFREALQRKLSRSERKTSGEKDALWDDEILGAGEAAADRSGRFSVAVYGSFRRESTLVNRRLQPIQRFRKAATQIKVLNTIRKAAEQQRKDYQQNTSSFVMMQQQLDNSKQIANSDGLSFDPNFYKAIKEVNLSNESIYILSTNPSSRSEEQVNAVIGGVKASVPAFGEYPSRMQRQLLSVGWYEKFEPNRVIIRQGHRALNFYFILSGNAVVSLTTKDKVTGASKDTTVAVLGKGHSFGELALLHDTARTATVICQSEVALLAVSRQDFIDIFLRSNEDDEEQEHIRFLRSVVYLKRLPLEECGGRLGICLCHYFRRGVVIDKDPTNSEWIYVVKSGSCRVLTRLSKPRTDPAYHLSRKLPKLKEEEISKNFLFPQKRSKKKEAANNEEQSNLLLPSINPLERLRPRTLSGPSSNVLAQLLASGERKKALDDMTLKRSRHESLSSRRSVNSRQGTYIYTSKSENDLKKGEEKHRQTIMKLVEAHKKELEDKSNKKGSNNNNNSQDVFVQTELLKPKDQFGLASLLYHDVPQTKSYLISNGAECVLLSKAWLRQKANESMLRALRSEISPFPSASELQQNLQDKANWDSYKSEVINGIISSRI